MPRKLLLVLLVIYSVTFFLLIPIVGYSVEWSGFGGYYKVTTQTTVSDNSKPTTTTTKEYVPPKTLWDWMNFLFIGLVTVLAAYFTSVYSNRQRENELAIASDKQREDALQAYIDKMSELLLKEHLDERTTDGKLKPEYEHVRNVARMRTITLLTQLDGRRIGYVL